MNLDAALGTGTGSAPGAIGVFDSGTGGLSVLQDLRVALPHQHFIYLDDSGHGPYGERDVDFVLARTLAISALLRARGVQALVIACNTATAAAAEAVRSAYPGLPVIAVEPAVKPATLLSRTRRIGVIATRGTLASERFGRLLALAGTDVECVAQACDGLAAAIDALAQQPDEPAALAAVDALSRRHLAAMGRFGTGPGMIDTLVLGCTHYVLVQPLLQSIVGPGVRMIATGEAVARQTAVRLGLALADGFEAPSGTLTLLSTGNAGRLARAAHHWLHPLRPEPAFEATDC